MVRHKIVYAQGWHFVGTPLWFDAERRRELCVLTGLAARLPPLHQRSLASAPLANALRAATSSLHAAGNALHAAGTGPTPSPLPSPWRRRLGVAGLQLEFFDVNAPLGGAAVRVETPQGSILMLGLLRQQAAIWPACDMVVARLPALQQQGASLAIVSQQVAAWLQAQPPSRGVRRLWVDHYEVGVLLWQSLSALGLSVAPRGLLHKLLQGAALLPPAADALPRQALANLYVAGSRTAPSPRPEDGYVDAGLGVLPAAALALPCVGLHARAHWHLQYFANPSSLQQVLQQTGARHLLTAELAAPAQQLLQQVCAQRALRQPINVQHLRRATQLSLVS